MPAYDAYVLVIPVLNIYRQIWTLINRIKGLASRYSPAIDTVPALPEPCHHGTLVPVDQQLVRESSCVPLDVLPLASGLYFGETSSLGCLLSLLNRTPDFDIPRALINSSLWQSDKHGKGYYNFISGLGPPPSSVAAGLFFLFQQSANIFFPILEKPVLAQILKEYYERSLPSASGLTSEPTQEDCVFYLVLAIGARIGKGDEPSLAAYADVYFDKAMSALSLECDHSSRTANIALFQRTLLVSVYLLFSPDSGDIWRHVGFAVRLFFDLSHRPSIEEDADHGMFCTLTRTLYCLER